MRIKDSIVTAALLAALTCEGTAQSAVPPTAPQVSQPGGPTDHAREPHRRPDVVGKITAIHDQTLTMKNPDGRSVTVTLTASTRFMKDRHPATLADFKVGDMAIVRGRSTGTDTWEAESLGTRGGGPGGDSRGDFAEGLGKKFIAGEIKAIEGIHLTIARMDGETQTIAVDENTSFRKESEHITLADCKVGDHVYGPGEVRDGTFVAAKLMLGDLHRMRGGPEGDNGPDPGDDRHPN